MQNYCKIIGALAAASALVASNASAEVDYSLSAGYSSGYLFRGLDLGDDLAEVSLNASTQAMGLDLSAGLWYGAWEAGPSPAQFDTDELDLYAAVSKDLGFATATIGYIYYHYPQADGTALFAPSPDTQEVYFSVAKSLFSVDFALTYFWDIVGDNDGYAELSGSKSFELSECLSLNTGAALGYFAEEGDLAHLTAKVALDWAITDTATVSPYVAHSWGLGETANYSSENEFVGGAKLAVSF